MDGWFFHIPVLAQADAAGAQVTYRLNSQLEAHWMFLLALALIVYVGLIYRKDGKGVASVPERAFLAALRLAALFAAFLILFEPVKATEKAERRKGVVLVLVDNSLSMDVHDRCRTDEALERVRAALGDLKVKPVGGAEAIGSTLTREQAEGLSRLDVAAGAVRASRLLEDLGRKHRVRLYGFSNALTAGGEAGEADIGRISATGPETRIGDCLRAALRELRGQPLAAAVLISDGRQNAGEDPASVFKGVRGQGVPVYAVAVGDPSDPKNVGIAAMDAPALVMPNDPATVSVALDARGYAAIGPIRVSLSLGGKEVAHATAEFPEGRGRRTVALTFRPAEPGEHWYAIEVPVQQDEIRTDDNRKEIQIKVVEQKIKVLYAEGPDLPRWEFRYLRNALGRDHTVLADVLLATADGGWIWDGSQGKEAIESFPRTEKELIEYDVLILGDISPGAFTKGQQDTIKKFVSEQGGGLICIAGERFMPWEFGRTPPLDEIIPVVPGAAALSSEDGPLQESFQLTLTSDGWNTSWTHLDPDDRTNREIWETRPGLYWFCVVKRAKKLATVLASHPAFKDEDGQRMPLIVTWPYGAGRVIYFGVDSLWLWRRGEGDRSHYRFYSQAIRSLATIKMLGGNKRFILASDRAAYGIGDRVTLTARVRDREAKWVVAEKVTAYGKAAGGEEFPMDLRMIPGQPGHFQGHFFPTAQGRYTFCFRPPDEPGTTAAEHSFEVKLPALELDEPRMVEQTLRALVSVSDGGRLFSVDQMAKIPPLVPEKHEDLVLESEEVLWDRWETFAFFCILITVEWLLRKRWRMM